MPDVWLFGTQFLDTLEGGWSRPRIADEFLDCHAILDAETSDGQYFSSAVEDICSDAGKQFVFNICPKEENKGESPLPPHNLKRAWKALLQTPQMGIDLR